MATTKDDQDFRNRIQRVETLLQDVERLPEAARACTREIVQTLLDLHGAGLEKILGRLADAGPIGMAVIDDLGRDDLVGSLLLLYGLHPLDLETRVRQALDKVRPPSGRTAATSSWSASTTAWSGCGCRAVATAAPRRPTLELSIEEAIYEKRRTSSQSSSKPRRPPPWKRRRRGSPCRWYTDEPFQGWPAL